MKKRKLKFKKDPKKAIRSDQPVVTKKSHINCHGEVCSERSIKPKSKKRKK